MRIRYSQVAVSNDYFVNDYVITEGDVSDYELMDDLYETGFSLTDYDMNNADDNFQTEI